jgi:hypothetical protein
MSQAQAVALKNEVVEAATRAVYQLQYNTQKACSFVVAEVPAASYEMALEAIKKVVKTEKPFKKAKVA